MNYKKIIGLLSVGILLAFFSMLFASVFGLFIQDPIHTQITIEGIITNLFKPNTLKIGLAIFVILILLIAYYAVKFGYFGHQAMMNREDRAKSGLHGQARFQTPEEMAKNFGEKESKKSYKAFTWNELYRSGFEGIICNSFKKNGKFYIEGCKEVHSLIVGGTGSGKTTGVISPTIQANAVSKKKSSMLIYDLKGDLYREHSELLEKEGYRVIVMDFKRPVQSVKYNPLAIIWDLYQEYLEAKAKGDIIEQTNLDTKISNYISDIALKIVPTASGENKVWSEGSQGIIKGLLWGMLEDSTVEGYNITKEKYTLSQISNILNIPSQREELFNFLQHRPKDSMVFKKSGIILNNDSEKTVSSYISNTQSNLEKFTEKSIELVTQSSDFEMKELLEQPTAIFVVIDDTNTATHILCSIFASQLRNYLVLHADTHGGALERTWYFLLDEFANLPKIENFNKWMSTDRSRKLFYCVILQSISQLKNIFNEEEKNEILNNCTLQVYLKASELQSLQYFQNLFGTFTEYSRSSNINEKSLEAGVYEGSKSLVQRHLVNIDDLQYIEIGNSYFFYAGLPPCKATLIPIYDEELNKNRTFQRGAYKTDIINKYPNFEECFYDLEIRHETYLNGGIPIPRAKIRKEEDLEENEYPELEEVTDEYISKTVDTYSMSEISEDKLLDILNLSQNKRMTDVEPIEEEIDDEPQDSIEDLTPEEPSSIETVEEKVIETPIVDEEDDEEDEIVEEWDETSQKMIETRYKKTYLSRLIQSTDTVKEYYSKLKNEILSYKKVKSFISSKHELFKKGVKIVAKLTFRGKTLCIYLALDPKTYEDSKYHIEDVSHKIQYEKTPAKYKISGPLKLTHCIELIADIMKNLEIDKGESQNVNYVSEYPYEESTSLFEKGLIKKVVIEKTLKSSPNQSQISTETSVDKSNQEEIPVLSQSKELELPQETTVIEEVYNEIDSKVIPKNVLEETNGQQNLEEVIQNKEIQNREKENIQSEDHNKKDVPQVHDVVIEENPTIEETTKKEEPLVQKMDVSKILGSDDASTINYLKQRKNKKRRTNDEDDE